MITNKLELINDQTSPLFRIMWAYNSNEPNRRQFGNNICAFHIGNGLILSVAHNLRGEAGLFSSIEENIFQEEVLGRINPALQPLFNTSYAFDNVTRKRYLNNINPAEQQLMKAELQRINFDTRWSTFMNRKMCKPYLIVQFKNNLFYQDAGLTAMFNPNMHFAETDLNRHTFLIELELVNSFESDDIAMYRIINTNQEIVNRLASIEPDFNLLSGETESFYCLQSAPTSSLGKLLNDAKIEGVTDHWSLFLDRIGGNYILEGYRYLIKGYFRFGSSGAPYIIYDGESGTYKVNAIQSEACPIQLSINGIRDGNFQYVNAIATPLNSIKVAIEEQLHLEEQLRA